VQLCEEINTIVGQGIWHDIFQVQTTKWLCVVNDIVRTFNSVKVLCGLFDIYSSYIAGILNLVKQIYLYVLCNKQITQNKL
jgi:hypothetical protein